MIKLKEKFERIILIGPVFPFKGGISHYTSLMYTSLSAQYNVEMMSYSFQYPKFLYKKEQRDYSNDSFKVDGTQFIINTANPLNWISVAKRINRLKPNLVVIQWWHPYFAPCYYSITKFIKKAKILFVCHNVFPHERFPLDRFLTKLTLKSGDCYIVQSSQDEHDLKSIIPDAVYKRAVHPTYNAFKMQNLTKSEARSALSISDDEKVMLFFGFVRKYKGLDFLLKAMPIIQKKIGVCRLLVVGDFGEDKDYYLDLINNNSIQSEVDIYDGYIPDREVEKFFSSCDVVVLPYVSATQSGIVQIAYGFEKPVIATNVGGLPDVVTDGKTGLLVEPENPDAIAEAVCRFYENKCGDIFRENVKAEAYRFSWDRMNEHIEKLYDEVQAKQ